MIPEHHRPAGRVFCVCGHEVQWHSVHDNPGRCLLQSADGSECPCTKTRPDTLHVGDTVYRIYPMAPSDLPTATASVSTYEHSTGCLASEADRWQCPARGCRMLEGGTNMRAAGESPARVEEHRSALPGNRSDERREGQPPEGTSPLADRGNLSADRMCSSEATSPAHVYTVGERALYQGEEVEIDHVADSPSGQWIGARWVKGDERQGSLGCFAASLRPIAQRTNDATSVGQIVEVNALARVTELDGKGLAHVRIVSDPEGWVSASLVRRVDADDPRLTEIDDDRPCSDKALPEHSCKYDDGYAAGYAMALRHAGEICERERLYWERRCDGGDLPQSKNDASDGWAAAENIAGAIVKLAAPRVDYPTPSDTVDMLREVLEVVGSNDGSRSCLACGSIHHVDPMGDGDTSCAVSRAWRLLSWQRTDSPLPADESICPHCGQSKAYEPHLPSCATKVSLALALGPQRHHDGDHGNDEANEGAGAEREGSGADHGGGEAAARAGHGHGPCGVRVTRGQDQVGGGGCGDGDRLPAERGGPLEGVGPGRVRGLHAVAPRRVMCSETPLPVKP